MRTLFLALLLCCAIASGCEPDEPISEVSQTFAEPALLEITTARNPVEIWVNGERAVLHKFPQFHQINAGDHIRLRCKGDCQHTIH